VDLRMFLFSNLYFKVDKQVQEAKRDTALIVAPNMVQVLLKDTKSKVDPNSVVL